MEPGLGNNKEDDGHPNRDRQTVQTQRQAGRQTEKDRQTDRQRVSVVELNSESREGMQKGGGSQDRLGNKSKIKRKRR